MLTKEANEKLKGLGIDPAKLAEAVSDEKEVEFAVPELKTAEELKGWLPADKKEEFGNNRFEQGKTQAEEILAKEFHDSNELGLADGKEGRKNLKAVIQAYGKKKVKESSKGNQEYLEEKENLQKTIKQLNDQIKQKDLEIQNQGFTFGVKEEVKANIPDELTIGKSHFETLLLATRRPVSENGRTVWYKGDQKLKDDLENPLDTKSVIAAFLDENPEFRASPGMGGTDHDKGRTHNGKSFKSTKEFYDWAIKSGKGSEWVNSPEGQQYLKDNKAEDFQY